MTSRNMIWKEEQKGNFVSLKIRNITKKTIEAVKREQSLLDHCASLSQFNIIISSSFNFERTKKNKQHQRQQKTEQREMDYNSIRYPLQ